LASVINNDNIQKHDVDKYSFKVLSTNKNDSNTAKEDTVLDVEHTQDEHPARRESDVDASALSSGSKDSLIESLMKKTDDMSSNFIKLQMKLEDMSDEHKKELQKVKEEAFNLGLQEGKKQALEDAESNRSGSLEQFSTSVATLQNSAQEFDTALEGIKKELISAALDIAQEVVSIEISENSSSIATVLSSELIKELQSASKITLKVNPKDHGAISEHVGSMKHIEVISDSAVSEGGVIALSDAGNIDAEISKRFERVKRAALSE